MSSTAIQCPKHGLHFMDSCKDCRIEELEQAFQVLEVYGVPKDRARNVPNGIEVLVTRMDKEIESLQAENMKLEAHLGAAIELGTKTQATIEEQAKVIEAVKGWAWSLHDDLKQLQCGDGCNGCAVCNIPDEACDTEPEQALSQQEQENASNT